MASTGIRPNNALADPKTTIRQTVFPIRKPLTIVSIVITELEIVFLNRKPLTLVSIVIPE
jgi:hypothetical protein